MTDMHRARCPTRPGAPTGTQGQALPAKAMATLQALAAMRGIMVDQINVGGSPVWVVRRWDLWRSTDEVRVLLARMGVQA